MAQRKEKEVTTPFLLTILTLSIYIAGVSPYTFGIYGAAQWYTRFTYQWIHVSIWHLLINLWVFYNITRTYKVRKWHYIIAYIISVPPILVGTVPTVGLSGICFALMGILWYQVLHTRLYHTWIAGFILAGFCVPGTNVWLHLYCYTAGALIGWLNRPYHGSGY